MTAAATARYEPPLSRVAAMIADPARSRMLAFLLDGHRASAGELAEAASVGASTASAHLAQLVDARLLAVEPRGRHRYFRIADADVAHALEALALVADRSSHGRRWAGAGRERLRYARCCYGHLAGELGVALHASLCRHGRMVDAAASLDIEASSDSATNADGGSGRDVFTLTGVGRAWLGSAGIDGAALRASASSGWACLDWSERRDHLAGPLAKALLDHFLAAHWLEPAPLPAGAPRATANRALRLTPAGHIRLLPLLDA